MQLARLIKRHWKTIGATTTISSTVTWLSLGPDLLVTMTWIWGALSSLPSIFWFGCFGSLFLIRELTLLITRDSQRHRFHLSAMNSLETWNLLERSAQDDKDPRSRITGLITLFASTADKYLQHHGIAEEGAMAHVLVLTNTVDCKEGKGILEGRTARPKEFQKGKALSEPGEPGDVKELADWEIINELVKSGNRYSYVDRASEIKKLIEKSRVKMRGPVGFLMASSIESNLAEISREDRNDAQRTGYLLVWTNKPVSDGQNFAEFCVNAGCQLLRDSMGSLVESHRLKLLGVHESLDDVGIKLSAEHTTTSEVVVAKNQGLAGIADDRTRSASIDDVEGSARLTDLAELEK